MIWIEVLFVMCLLTFIGAFITAVICDHFIDFLLGVILSIFIAVGSSIFYYFKWA